jgi:hypothetical protein
MVLHNMPYLMIAIGYLMITAGYLCLAIESV